MIPYGRQEITDSDIEAVLDVLRSDFLTQGPKVPEFEGSVCSKVGSSFAAAVNSATSALHLSCLALGLKKGGLLWTSPISFVASANCGLYCGAEIDFIDVNPSSYNISIEALREKLEEAEKKGRLPDILIPVHMCGQSCDMESIRRLSDQYGFKVIEDASHAIGGMYKGTHIGSCEYSDITVFSFHPVKIVTSGEGGMALTNDVDLFDRVSLLRSHGITREEGLMTEISDGPWYYQQIALGYNYRMTDLQAALGTSQLSRLEQYVERRNMLARRYDNMLKGCPIQTPHLEDDCLSSFHLYVIRLKLDEMNVGRGEVFRYMRENGVGVNVHYIPIHKQPWYRDMPFFNGPFPEAERYYEEALTLPLFPTMTFAQQDYVVETLRKAVSL